MLDAVRSLGRVPRFARISRRTSNKASRPSAASIGRTSETSETDVASHRASWRATAGRAPRDRAPRAPTAHHGARPEAGPLATGRDEPLLHTMREDVPDPPEQRFVIKDRFR